MDNKGNLISIPSIVYARGLISDPGKNFGEFNWGQIRQTQSLTCTYCLGWNTGYDNCMLCLIC